MANERLLLDLLEAIERELISLDFELSAVLDDRLELKLDTLFSEREL